MKKEYINPTMEIVKIEALQMLTASLSTGDNYDGRSEVLSRELDDILDF